MGQRKSCSPSLTAAEGLSCDPKFRHPERGDYTIRSSSGCVNFGDNDAWTELETSVDIRGDRRLKGRRIDLGCYEGPLPPGLMLLVK